MGKRRSIYWRPRDDAASEAQAMSASMSMARFEELRRMYEREMTPEDAKKLALADAQYEADERQAIQDEQ